VCEQGAAVELSARQRFHAALFPHQYGSLASPSFRVEAGASAVAGAGLFVRGSAAAGDLIALYPGELREAAAARDWWAALAPQDPAAEYTASLVDGAMVDASPPAAARAAEAAARTLSLLTTHKDALSVTAESGSMMAAPDAAEAYSRDEAEGEKWLAASGSLGHLVNHPPLGSLPNTAFYEFDAAWLHGDVPRMELSKTASSTSVSSDEGASSIRSASCLCGGPACLLRALPLRSAEGRGARVPVRAVAVVALGAVVDEELLADYGLGGDAPAWFHAPWALVFGTDGADAAQSWHIPLRTAAAPSFVHFSRVASDPK